ncbi:ABC-three component system protein [Vreelandella alkaliphila]|uniref:ABC-three component system protein n=1 Tax=Vreelandella alkaliphila TaxID=272774 RepID=UPI003FD73317
MTNAEQMTEHCVMVNGGSGVLVSAMSQDYSYVLTARHVLKAQDNQVINHQKRPIRIIDFHEHPNADYDCAVIQVQYVPSIKQSAWPATIQGQANLSMVGFPETSRETVTPIKVYNGTLTSVIDERIVVTLEGSPGQKSIAGMSGGGVYYIRDDRPYLVGVECRMDGEHEEERYARVQCHSLSRFAEIIETKGLAPMVPCFLECFSRLREYIFGFNVIDPQSVQNLQARLWWVADTLVEQGLPAPFKIMEKYKGDLLVSSGRPSEVQDRDLWVAYFEFIVICALIDEVRIVDDAYIQSIERKRRILYTSDRTNWIRSLDEILKAARRMLDENGTIVVASPQEDAEMLPPDAHVNRIIKDIASVPNSGSFLQIDNANDAIYKTFVLTHLKGLRKACVVDNEDKFAGVTSGIDKLQLFRDLYNEVIK